MEGRPDRVAGLCSRPCMAAAVSLIHGAVDGARCSRCLCPTLPLPSGLGPCLLRAPSAALQAIPTGPGPLQDANDQINFFLIWQPIYASITVSICLQDTVRTSRRAAAAVGGAAAVAACPPRLASSQAAAARWGCCMPGQLAHQPVPAAPTCTRCAPLPPTPTPHPPTPHTLTSDPARWRPPCSAASCAPP